MDKSHRILARILGRTVHQGTTEDIQMRVVNLTRATVLTTTLRVANDAATRRKGLLGQNILSPGEGLWIIPCEAVHTIGMKFSIDIVYIDRNYLVKKTRSDVQPMRLSFCIAAHSVLELAAGTILATQTMPGDRLSLQPG